MIQKVLILYCTLLLVLFTGCSQETPQENNSAAPTDNLNSSEDSAQNRFPDLAPYLIMYQDDLYVNWGKDVTRNNTEGMTELGQIHSTVPDNQEPLENFQSNIGLVGHTLWCDGEQLLLESELPDVYLIFEPY